MRLIPAILAETRDDMERMVRVAETFTDYVQVDFMDGRFVPMRSVSLQAVRDIAPAMRMEAHLMVKHPRGYLEALQSTGFEKVIFHVESADQPMKVIERARWFGLNVRLAIHPETPVDEIDHLVEKTDGVLFLTVEPGSYGNEFVPDVLGKIKEFKGDHPDIPCGIDGGVKFENLDVVISAPIDVVTIGSGIFEADDPAKAYRELSQRIERMAA
ncbi:MAG: hypothetical protein M1335_02055 [Chloroflexi bacterium]|nr:hypothetical protein [Chloroflexota bacterium]